MKQEKQEPGFESSGCDYPLPGGVIIKQEVLDGNKLLFTVYALPCLVRSILVTASRCTPRICAFGGAEHYTSVSFRQTGNTFRMTATW